MSINESTMKYLFSFILFFFCLNVWGQSDSIPGFIRMDWDMDSVLYEYKEFTILTVEAMGDFHTNLSKYQEVRQRAFSTAGISILLGASSVVAYNNQKSSLGDALAVGGGIFAVTSFAQLVSAEKHLKKAIISISPTGLKVKF